MTFRATIAHNLRISPTSTWNASRGATRLRDRSQPPDQAHQHATNLNVFHADRLHPLVLRLERDVILPLEEPLERRLAIDHRHDDLAVATRRLRADHGDVAVQNVSLDHRVPF